MMHMAVTYSPEDDVLIYDRKLRDGPGESMYGLEVCKSLHLPTDFLQRAHDIRMKYNPKTRNTLSMGSSHYNAQKLKGMCELCKKNEAVEVHHLQHQKEASESNSYISSFHKNHKANLINVCNDCHDEIHKSNKQHRVTKTTGGYEIMDI
jgi:DNA mismatch repair protein MutS